MKHPSLYRYLCRTTTISSPIYQTTHSIFSNSSSIRNCYKFQNQLRYFRSSPKLQAIPLIPAALAAWKPLLIVATKFSIKLGRPLFIAMRWSWFFIPRRFRGKFENFFQHRYFHGYSRWNFIAFISTLWALIMYGYFENLEEVPYSFRRRFCYMEMEHLYDISADGTNEQLLQYKDRFLPKTHPLYIKIEKTVNKLANMAKMNGILDMKFNVFVIDDLRVKNAFVLPNGNVFVYTGICNVFNDDDSLGILLGHEMSHVIASHAAEAACRESSLLMIDAFIFALVSLIIPSNYLFGITEWFRLQVMGLITDLPFSRLQEKEADYIGLILAKQCGYDISKGATMWPKMADEEGDNLPEIFSSHPSHATRTKDIISSIPHVNCLGKHCTVF